jgi:hypothetical protein
MKDEEQNELQKCIDEPWYFYNQYCTINGLPIKEKITKEEWEDMIKRLTFKSRRRSYIPFRIFYYMATPYEILFQKTIDK